MEASTAISIRSMVKAGKKGVTMCDSTYCTYEVCHAAAIP